MVTEAGGGRGQAGDADPTPLRAGSPPPAGREWLTALDGWSTPAVTLLAVLLTGLVGFLDWRTGAHLSFSIFYLMPVAVVAWVQGRIPGLGWAVVAAVVWLWIDLAEQRDIPVAIQYWNAAVRLGFFILGAVSLAELRRMWETARTLAGTDYLTGALNARAFRELVDLERSRALRYNRPFTLAYIDVDEFKAVNDRLGHSQGDTALRTIATTIRENIRSMDTVARLGGDEFGLLLPETGPGAAEVALRKIQHRLAEAMASQSLPLTFSIGAVICVGPPESVDQLIQRADALMYEVKRSGRNDLRTVVLDENFGIEAILQRS